MNGNLQTTGGASLPVGVRNNNPLNIRVSSNTWLGKIPSNNAFEKFTSLEYGIRAGVKNLLTYYNNYQLRTISQIITKWAPPTENDTSNYIKSVATKMGIASTSVLLLNKNTFASLVSAMSEIELGKQYGISKDKVLSVINQFSLIP